ncbi:MAG TPA: hypothetical protein VFB63_11155 [Bryobacteraceae bacterium]|nr:hypothetical protein [Bryobacteraceae bacterium]
MNKEVLAGFFSLPLWAKDYAKANALPLVLSNRVDTNLTIGLASDTRSRKDQVDKSLLGFGRDSGHRRFHAG